MKKNSQIRESSFTPNTINQGDGLELLRSLSANSAKLVFFDPQYEPANKVSRTKDWPLAYQNSAQISQFLREIARILQPSGFCLLWVNKNLLTYGRVLSWLSRLIHLKIVDLLIWIKPHFGFGNYFRNQAEFAFLLQKQPANSKLFKNRGFGNVWTEQSLPTRQRKHPHQKPRKLIKALLEATTNEGDLIVDPCAGSFIVLEVCQATNREFIGCDLTYQAMEEFKTQKPSSQTLNKICLGCLELV